MPRRESIYAYRGADVPGGDGVSGDCMFISLSKTGGGCEGITEGGLYDAAERGVKKLTAEERLRLAPVGEFCYSASNRRANTVRHKYEYCIDIQGSSAAAWVSRFVGSGKRVLELGAGPGSITRVLTNVQHCSVTAVERDTTAIPKLTPTPASAPRLPVRKANGTEIMAKINTKSGTENFL